MEPALFAGCACLATHIYNIHHTTLKKKRFSLTAKRLQPVSAVAGFAGGTGPGSAGASGGGSGTAAAQEGAHRV